MDTIRSTSGKTAIEVAREAAVDAGTILIERFTEAKTISFKGRGNIVTDVDTQVERAIFDVLGREFPAMGLLGEESEGVSPDSGYVWIVDPIDGTRNYASGIPFFSVVVGLVLDGEVLAGVNYDPMRQEMFHAVRGGGAFLNGEPIHVSEKTRIADGILGMDLSYNDEGASNGLNVILSLWPGMQTARIMGSSALGISYAAAGRHDLYFHHQLEPWDQVAGLLLVEEAGGIITDRTGKRAGLYSDGLIASNAVLHAEFMRKTEGMPLRRPTHGLA
jgi:myo-inositol-1(or 4)-monophosphatase